MRPTLPGSPGVWRTISTCWWEMDADGSHQPEELPLPARRVARCRPCAGIPVCSGRQCNSWNWPKSREVLSRGGN